MPQPTEYKQVLPSVWEETVERSGVSARPENKRKKPRKSQQIQTEMHVRMILKWQLKLDLILLHPITGGCLLGMKELRAVLSV